LEDPLRRWSRPWKIAAVALLAAGPALVAGPARAADPGWASDGYGPGATFYNPNESSINAGTVGGVKLKWSRTLRHLDGSPCGSFGEPVSANGRVFVTDQAGIAAYQVSTGQRLWTFDYEDPEDNGAPRLSIAGGTLLAGNNDCNSNSDPNGRLLALDAATGAKLWDLGLDPPVESMVVDRGVVVVSGSSPSDAETVAAYRIGDGSRAWSRQSYASPGISAGGRLLVNRTDRDATSALDVRTGKVLWTRLKRWDGMGSAPAGDRFYVSDGTGSLISITSTGGAVKWTARRQNGLIAADGRRIYRVAGERVAALNATTGKQLWSREFLGETGQPVRAGGLLYTGIDGGNPLGVLHASTGKLASGGRQFGNVETGKVIVTGGWVFYTDYDTLKAFSL
jgi:outer membrane protein assembly factor BamB